MLRSCSQNRLEWFNILSNEPSMLLSFSHIAAEGANNALLLPTEAFQSQETCANSTLKTSLEEQPEKASSQCCSMKEKDEKSELEGIEKELEKAALAPTNTFPSKYHEMPFLHDFCDREQH